MDKYSHSTYYKTYNINHSALIYYTKMQPNEDALWETKILNDM